MYSSSDVAILDSRRPRANYSTLKTYPNSKNHTKITSLYVSVTYFLTYHIWLWKVWNVKKYVAFRCTSNKKKWIQDYRRFHLLELWSNTIEELIGHWVSLKVNCDVVIRDNFPRVPKTTVTRVRSNFGQEVWRACMIFYTWAQTVPSIFTHWDPKSCVWHDHEDPREIPSMRMLNHQPRIFLSICTSL